MVAQKRKQFPRPQVRPDIELGFQNDAITGKIVDFGKQLYCPAFPIKEIKQSL